MLYSDHVYFGKTFRMRENTKDTSTTGTTLWPAGTAFLRYVEKNKGVRDRFEGKVVVELGSGCSLVGIVLASIGSFVTLTDFPSIEYLADYNVQTNKDNILQYLDEYTLKDRIQFKPLIWGEPSDLGLETIDYIIDQVDLLIVTMLKLCSPKTIVFVASEIRCHVVHDYFLKQFDKYFNCTQISNSRMVVKDSSFVKIYKGVIKKIKDQEDVEDQKE